MDSEVLEISQPTNAFVNINYNPIREMLSIHRDSAFAGQYGDFLYAQLLDIWADVRDAHGRIRVLSLHGLHIRGDFETALFSNSTTSRSPNAGLMV